MSDSAQYEVLSPWAEVDQVPVRGISPRLKGLNGKTIGLFDNGKPKSRPMLNMVEKKLKERFPGVRIDYYEPVHKYRYHVIQTASDNKPTFEIWVNGIDGVVASVGN
jgi:hypothetical protein